MTLAFVDVRASASLAAARQRLHQAVLGRVGRGTLDSRRAGRTSGRLTFPPKPFCPYDWGREVEWVELSGRGKLYSQTVIHAAPAAFAARSADPQRHRRSR